MVFLPFVGSRDGVCVMGWGLLCMSVVCRVWIFFIEFFIFFMFVIFLLLLIYRGVHLLLVCCFLIV